MCTRWFRFSQTATERTSGRESCRDSGRADTSSRERPASDRDESVFSAQASESPVVGPARLPELDEPRQARAEIEVDLNQVLRQYAHCSLIAHAFISNMVRHT